MAGLRRCSCGCGSHAGIPRPHKPEIPRRAVLAALNPQRKRRLRLRAALMPLVTARELCPRDDVIAHRSFHLAACCRPAETKRGHIQGVERETVAMHRVAWRRAGAIVAWLLRIIDRRDCIVSCAQHLSVYLPRVYPLHQSVKLSPISRASIVWPSKELTMRPPSATL